MKSPITICPVPSEQQPINEYADLKESCFFRWATLHPWNYLTPMVWIWCLSWLFVGPIAAFSFPPLKHPLSFMISGIAGATFCLALPLLQLYTGWSYVCDRLLNDKIFYEESGWYDGQLWLKPPDVQARDRLIASYEIKPILMRLKRSLAFLALVLLASSLTGCWLCTLV